MEPRSHDFATLILPIALTVSLVVGQAAALSTDRAGNLFGTHEPIVLQTAATGTASWTLTNDYGETVRGQSPVTGGEIRIPTTGLRFGRYTFAVDGDGQIAGGVVPPPLDVHPNLAPLIFAPFRLHWDNPEEALLWKQLGAYEIRYEFGLDRSNPAQSEFTFDPAIDRYMQALHDLGLRPTFKLNGPPRWNDTSTERRKWGEPKDYELYAESVRRFAEHYRPFGVDRYYVLNEPDAGGWWVSGWEGYHRFLAASDDALADVAPALLTIAPNSWSNAPGFVDPVLQSGRVDVLSGHYPVEKIIGNVHADFYFTRMRKTGVVLPFINGEDFSRWRSSLTLEPQTSNYPGLVGYSTVWGVGPVMMANLDVEAYRVVALHLLMDGEQAPFERWEAGNVLPGPLCFEFRAASDTFAGTRLVRRLEDAPPHVLAWWFERGSDRFMGGYVAPAEMAQLLVVHTAAPSVQVVDCFGNARTVEAENGQVRVLLTNAATYVHGLSNTDRVEFVPQDRNESPRIAAPAPPPAAVGVPWHYQLDGYDVEANPVEANWPTWSLLEGPAGMTIRAGSGVLEWQPSAPGAVTVRVGLRDSQGAAAERSFAIEVGPAEAPLPPEFVTLPAPVAVKGRPYRYVPRAVDPRSGPVTYAVSGPAGMIVRDGSVEWTPTEAGAVPVRVTARTQDGAEAAQAFELVVRPNPDRPQDGQLPPRPPSELTVVRAEPGGVTLVWNVHHFGQTRIQRAASPEGPWTDAGTTESNWYTDEAVDGPTWYRAIAHHGGGDSEPSAPVEGRMPLIADAGPSVKLDVPGSAALDARGSSGPSGAELRYEWRVVAAPPGAGSQFEASDRVRTRLTVDQPGRYVVSLRVSDGQRTSAPDYAWVVVGGPPLVRVAYAGPDRQIAVGETAPLQALTATPAQREAGWFWRWDEAPFYGYVGIQDDHRRAAALTPELPGVYQIQLFALDEQVWGCPDVVRVVVAPPSGE